MSLAGVTAVRWMLSGRSHVRWTCSLHCMALLCLPGGKLRYGFALMLGPSEVTLPLFLVSSFGDLAKFNPFTPKSDQLQIPPAASPEISCQTAWITWFFIAHSVERWLYYQFSLSLIDFSLKVGRMYVLNLGVKGLKWNSGTGLNWYWVLQGWLEESHFSSLAHLFVWRLYRVKVNVLVQVFSTVTLGPAGLAGKVDINSEVIG